MGVGVHGFTRQGRGRSAMFEARMSVNSVCGVWAEKGGGVGERGSPYLLLPITELAYSLLTMVRKWKRGTRAS